MHLRRTRQHNVLSNESQAVDGVLVTKVEDDLIESDAVSNARLSLAY